MIKDIEAGSNIWKTNCQTIVVPVNCVGVMGAGLAKDCRRLFPKESQQYIDYCEKELFLPGELLFIEKLIFFPTKLHWKFDSLEIYIELGLNKLLEQSHLRRIKTIALPAIGCGCGNLSIEKVYEQVSGIFKDDTDVRIDFYHVRK